MRRITVLSMLLVMALLSMTSCSPKVSQQEYDRVSSELSAIQSQLASLQGKLSEAESLQGEYEELSERYDTVKSEFETMQAKYEELSGNYDKLHLMQSEHEAMQSKYDELSTEYEELNSKYEELSKKYEEATEEPAEINEEDLEQAIFQLINQERINNGIDELIWSDLLHKWAIQNSLNMSIYKRYEYSDYGSWQEIFWAAGYDTIDKMANAAFIVWKNSLQYETNIINKNANYGTVAVFKSGEIYYITYIASPIRG